MTARKKTSKKVSGARAKKIAGKFLNMTKAEFCSKVGAMDEAALEKFFDEEIQPMAGSIVSQAEKE